MKVEVKKVDALKRELKFEIPREKVTEAMDLVYNEIGKHAKVKGFRPGKVPRHILADSHGQLAKLRREIEQLKADVEAKSQID